jgi:hypothetical protein
MPAAYVRKLSGSSIVQHGYNADLLNRRASCVTRSFSSATTSSSFCAMPLSRRYLSPWVIESAICPSESCGLIDQDLAAVPNRRVDQAGTEQRLNRQRPRNLVARRGRTN